MPFCFGYRRYTEEPSPLELDARPVKPAQESRQSILTAILIISLLVNLAQYSYISSNPRINTTSSNRELENKYNNLFDQYQTLNQKYSNLSYEYEKLKSIALVPPYSSISKGNVSWVFYDLRGNIVDWTLTLDTYRSYVAIEKPKNLLYFTTNEGTKTHYDIRPYIQPSFFKQVIASLTRGRSDTEFVKEVDNLKNQITIYGEGLGDAPYRFPAETLIEGKGMCADTTILMASMLIEGNRQANYNFKVYIWYVYLDGDTTLSDKSAVDSNHAIVEVDFQDKEKWCLETTTNYFFTYSQSFRGWQYEVTTTSR